MRYVRDLANDQKRSRIGPQQIVREFLSADRHSRCLARLVAPRIARRAGLRVEAAEGELALVARRVVIYETLVDAVKSKFEAVPPPHPTEVVFELDVIRVRVVDIVCWITQIKPRHRPGGSAGVVRRVREADVGRGVRER